MKKTIIPIGALLLTGLSFASCGGGEHKTEETASAHADSAKTEQVAEAPAAVVKDFKYYDNLANNIKIDGLTLNRYNAYVDTASKNFSYNYQVTNKESGIDQIVINAGKTSAVMNKNFKESYASLDGYKSYINDLWKTEKDTKITDFKEYKKGDATFYYFHYTKPVSDRQFENKYFHNVSAQYVPGEVHMDVLVSIKDKQGDPAKAEAVLQKVADYLAM